MARPLSWLDRLIPITRAVDASARSHYDRKDIQQLFEIQSRSAQNLMAAMPIVQVGNVHLLKREVLHAFLQSLVESENPAEVFAALRSRDAKPVHRKLKALSLQDVSADLDTPPENMTLQPGEIRVRFQTAEELAEAMVYLAAILQTDLEAFVARYEPPPERNTEEQQEEERRKADAAYIKSWAEEDTRTI